MRTFKIKEGDLEPADVPVDVARHMIANGHATAITAKNLKRSPSAGLTAEQRSAAAKKAAATRAAKKAADTKAAADAPADPDGT